MTVPSLARGVAKTLAFLPETTFGAQALSGTPQILRRNQSTMNLQIQEINSNEILPSQQMRDARQGTRLLQGQISSQLSCLTYEALIANLFRSSFVAGVSKAAITDSVVVVTASSITFTSVSSNFLTTGFKVGDVVNISGSVAPALGNNAVNLIVTGVTATVLTFAPPVAGTITAYSTGQTVSVSVVGKKLLMPSTLATSNIGSLTFEHFYSDVGVSELGLGCRMTSMSLAVPPSGLVTCNFGFTGQQLATFATEQLPSPTAPTTTGLLTAVKGNLLLFGAPIAYITGFNLQISAQADAPPVVGTPLTPNIFMGNLMASGSLTALFASDGITNAFLNETEFQIQLFLTDSGNANANFISVFLPRVKIFSDNKNDGTMEITRSLNFRALEQDLIGGTGLAYDDTTVTIQDSLAV